MYKSIKDIADYILAVILLVLLLPFMIFVLIIQLFFVKKPLFVQERPGIYGKKFKIIKFRTLEINGDDTSITSFGKFLRRTSIDELPQLINILKGEMSFVGPRPLLVEYLSKYSNRQLKRHRVKPGITGLAQVSGRNILSWNESLELDVIYVENLSFKQDLNILIKTLVQIFKFKEVNSSPNQTRERYKG